MSKEKIIKYRKAILSGDISSKEMEEEEDMMCLRLSFAKILHGKTPEDIIECAKNSFNNGNLISTKKNDWESLPDYEKYFLLSKYIPLIDVFKNNSGKRIIILTEN